ncbi:hypothetical protein [Pseudomonas juntendi]|uniref:hypothetical protein n=1 Tax=Pseudomonas juntendi TaxID=2666183 RepID=UPI001F27B6ED|nr:hypothetical protein [Pseudomonas juntendi]
MADELTKVTVAVISGAAVIAGMAVQWILNSITADIAARRAEKSDRRKSIEEKYLSVQASIDLFLRSKITGNELDRELAHLKAVVDLLADVKVREAFNRFVVALAAFQKNLITSKNNHVYFTDAGEEFPNEWNRIIDAQDEISSAMRDNIQGLRSFKD